MSAIQKFSVLQHICWSDMFAIICLSVIRTEHDYSSIVNCTTHRNRLISLQRLIIMHYNNIDIILLDKKDYRSFMFSKEPIDFLLLFCENQWFKFLLALENSGWFVLLICSCLNSVKMRIIFLPCFVTQTWEKLVKMLQMRAFILMHSWIFLVNILLKRIGHIDILMASTQE